MPIHTTRKVFHRNWRYYAMLFVFPLVYNKIGYGKLTDTPIFSLKFIGLYLSVCFLTLMILFWIAHLARLRVNTADQATFSSRILRLLFYPIAVAPGLFALVAYVYGSFYANAHLAEILLANAKYRFSIYVLATLGFSYWRLQREKKRVSLMRSDTIQGSNRPQVDTVVPTSEVVEAEILPELVAMPSLEIKASGTDEIKEVLIDILKPLVDTIKDQIPVQTPLAPQHVSPSLQDNIPLYMLYQVLIVQERGVLYNQSGHIRFFDIVIVKFISKGAIIYLIDGSRIICYDFKGELEKYNLLSWMVRLGRSTFVNMMHMDYHQYKTNGGNQLRLQENTLTRMLAGGLAMQELVQLLTFGGDIGDRYVVEFLKERSDLSHKGWDTFVEIKRKKSNS